MGDDMVACRQYAAVGSVEVVNACSEVVVCAVVRWGAAVMVVAEVVEE